MALWTRRAAGARRPGPRSRPASVVAISLLMLLGVAPVWAATSAEPGSVAGTVDTLAGPGYCTGSATRDPVSTTVGALAVDAQNRLYFDTGPAGRGLVAQTDLYGRAGTLTSGVGVEAVRAGDLAGLSASTPSASRLVVDGKGGVILTTGSRLIDLDSGNGVTTLAGDPAAAPGMVGRAASGDGGPAVDARFVSARSVAADAAGNLYAADLAGPGQAAFRIRMVNRGTEPAIVYPGTPEQLVLEPQHIDTLAGGGQDGADRSGGLARSVTLAGMAPVMAAAPPLLYAASYVVNPSTHRGSTRVVVVNLGPSSLVAHGVTVDPGRVQVLFGSSGRPEQPPQLEANGRSAGFVPGMSTDSAGNLLLADEWNHRVLQVDRAGVVRTLAGGPTSGSRGGFNGNELPADRAWLNAPYDVKVGHNDRVYISDGLNGQVRYLDGGGRIHASLGSGVALTWSCAPTTGEPGPREVATMGGPTSVAADSHGNVYFTLASQHQVKRLGVSGTVATVVGGADGAPTLQERLERPTALSLDSSGNLYVLDGGRTQVLYANLGTQSVRVYGVTVPAGSIRSVVGSGTSGLSGDGGPALAAQLGSLGSPGDLLTVGPRMGFASIPDLRTDGGAPQVGAIAIDPRGVLFVADLANNRIRTVDGSGSISTFAGIGAPGELRGCCTDPTGLALDAAGNLFVSDLGIADDPAVGYAAHPRIWAINRSGRPTVLLGQMALPGRPTVVAGTGAPGLGGESGPALTLPLLTPRGLAAGRRGDLFFAEDGELRHVDAQGRVATAMGTGQRAFNGDGLPAKLTDVGYPTDVALDRCGNLLVADLGIDRIRRLSLSPRCQPIGPEPGAAQTSVAGGLGRVWLAMAAVVLALLIATATVGRRLWRAHASG